MRGAIVLLAGLAFTASANAAPPAITATATPVAAFPASHGCVRVPMWIAPSLFGTNDYGTTVVVHL